MRQWPPRGAYWTDSHLALYVGNCLHMDAIPAGSVHCVVTSPPYLSKRKYKTEPLDWPDGWRGHLGLEPSPEMFIAHLIEIFREVKRVLRDDGTCWVNLGDTHAAGSRKTNKPDSLHLGDHDLPCDSRVCSDLPDGDLIGIPWRFALAMQADGWRLRQDIIWQKPAPMPESVNGVRWEHRDDGLVLRRGSWRPTNSHEYIFMFSKSNHYYADREAVKEAWTDKRPSDIARALNGSPKYGGKGGDVAQMRVENMSFPGIRPVGNPNSGRNLRSVWKIGPETFKGAHFATFPTELPIICIKASTSEAGVCPKCGAQWARVVKVKPNGFSVRIRDAKRGVASAEEGYRASQEEIEGYLLKSGNEEPNETETIGWRATCTCQAGDPIPATVLDPFAGTFTSGLAAKRLGRRAIGYELSIEYAELAIDRNRQAGLYLDAGKTIEANTGRGGAQKFHNAAELVGIYDTTGEIDPVEYVQ